ncbi:hypothetical protein ABT093_27780 [Kitasatospora sp. NPDC002551]|uniref:hypothetical protein n=1 Tax=Kitasatospora sp. NPDC002551 TaxID=3154539 RepID=UPI0033234629
MRSAAVTRTRARIPFRRARSRPLRLGLGLLTVLVGGLGWWLSAGPGQLPGGAVPALLAAGGWGLGMIPVHADWRSTGPPRRRTRVRRRTGEPVVEPVAGPPAG